MKIIQKNILEIEKGVIVHSVNCRGVMGSGLAFQIRKKYPEVFERYKQYKFKLGQTQFVRVTQDELYVCNLAGQENYGTAERHTNYIAVGEGLSKVRNFCTGRQLQAYIPFNMGCGLGGGDWKMISDLIETNLPDAIICKL